MTTRWITRRQGVDGKLPLVTTVDARIKKEIEVEIETKTNELTTCCFLIKGVGSLFADQIGEPFNFIQIWMAKHWINDKRRP